MIFLVHRYESSTMLRVLNTMVIVQLICHIPRSALNAFEFYMVIYEAQLELSNVEEILQALTAEEISSEHPWLVDLSHLMLTVAAASKVLILTAQVSVISVKLLNHHNNPFRM